LNAFSGQMVKQGRIFPWEPGLSHERTVVVAFELYFDQMSDMRMTKSHEQNMMIEISTKMQKTNENKKFAQRIFIKIQFIFTLPFILLI